MSDDEIPAAARLIEQALSVEERQILLDLISDEQSRVNPTTRERFNLLTGLLLKIRGGYAL